MNDTTTISTFMGSVPCALIAFSVGVNLVHQLDVVRHFPAAIKNTLKLTRRELSISQLVGRGFVSFVSSFPLAFSIIQA